MSVFDDIIDLGFENVVVFKNPDYEDAIIGVSLDGNAVYDYYKMIEHLINKHKMTEDEAIEWIDYNVVRALPYLKDSKPIIIYYLNNDDETCEK